MEFWKRNKAHTGYNFVNIREDLVGAHKIPPKDIEDEEGRCL